MRDADAKRVSQYVRKAQAERRHAMTKLHTCAACHQPRITNDYNHRSDGSRYPNCVHCGNKRAKVTKPPAEPRFTQMRECACCGVVKGLCRDFVLQRDSTRARVGYTADCRQCRTENNAKLLQMSESQSARRAKAKKAEPVKIEPPKPVTHSWEMLGLEWSGRKVYDPYSMQNRHEGVRT